MLIVRTVTILTALQMDLPLGLSLSVICCLSSACCLQIPRHLSKSLLILDSSFL